MAGGHTTGGLAGPGMGPGHHPLPTRSQAPPLPLRALPHFTIKCPPKATEHGTATLRSCFNEWSAWLRGTLKTLPAPPGPGAQSPRPHRIPRCRCAVARHRRKPGRRMDTKSMQNLLVAAPSLNVTVSSPFRAQAGQQGSKHRLKGSVRSPKTSGQNQARSWASDRTWLRFSLLTYNRGGDRPPTPFRTAPGAGSAPTPSRFAMPEGRIPGTRQHPGGDSTALWPERPRPHQPPGWHQTPPRGPARGLAPLPKGLPHPGAASPKPPRPGRLSRGDGAREIRPRWRFAHRTACDHR